MDTQDVIVVGSGSSGGALAARLSEDPACRVLLLEAGPVYRSVDVMPEELLLPTRIAAATPGNPHNWALPAELRPGRTMAYPRGKVLGGSSSINGCYFVRGTPEDFDTWSGLGNDEWSYEKVLPAFTRSESDRDFGGEYHGADGPIPVTRETSDRVPGLVAAFDAACAELGYAWDPDKNAPSGGGVGPTPLNVLDGRRVGTALGYLLPAMTRPNLTIVGNAFARRVCVDRSRAVGVEAVVDGRPTTFSAPEVVVACGALRSPHLLLCSGIGPAAHLREHGIDVVVDLPGVGRNLTDHATVQANWDTDAELPDVPDRGAITSVLHWRGSDGAQMEMFPMVLRTGHLLGLGGALDPSLRPAYLVTKVFHTESRGSVTLASADPDTMPVLRWNLLSTDRDRAWFRELMRTVYQVFDAKPLREYGARIVGITPRLLDDDRALDEWIAANIATGHPCCTAKMGPESDADAVVDQYLRVRGVEGLRVADTSVFPTITSRGPNATAVMLGERAAELIVG